MNVRITPDLYHAAFIYNHTTEFVNRFPSKGVYSPLKKIAESGKIFVQYYAFCPYIRYTLFKIFKAANIHKIIYKADNTAYILIIFT